MKKFLKKFGVLFFAFVSFVSMTCFFCGKKSNDDVLAEATSTYYSFNQSTLENIVAGGGTKLKSYNLANYYPLIAENQTSSNFCWIYSSMKSLETSFMVQTDEYYNFSEVGQAYLNYANTIGANFDGGANFSSFVDSYQEYGLILESDFSNTEFQAMNSNTDTKTYYSYVSDYATKKYNPYIKPYDLARDDYYMSLDYEDRRTVIKNFILKYGGMFVGIEGGNKGTKENPKYVGCFYFDESAGNNTDGIYNFYSYARSPSSYTSLNGDHAVTLIGWNDEISFGTNETGAFIAMNSWGFEPGRTDTKTGTYHVNSCEYFYIPYSYNFIYGKEGYYGSLGGFVIEPYANSKVDLVSSNQSSLSEVIPQAKDIKNYFCYDDDISLTYKIKNVDLTNLKIKISNSSKDFTSYFTRLFDNDQNQVTIALGSGISDFYGGYYTIDFYNGEELIAKKSLYIFSGTEIGNFKFMYNVASSSETDTFALNNAFLSSNNTATIYVSGNKDYYYLSFNYATMTSYGRISGNENYHYLPPEISDISVISASGTTSIENADNLFHEKTSVSSNVKNTFFYQIGYATLLKNLKNSMVRFKITINSALYDCEREFVINMFVSELDVTEATTSKLNLIRYELDGGENDAENITKYPSALDEETYEKIDINMTTITLKNPTKHGYAFVGWYLDSDLSGEIVTQITKLDGNIVLYAKWIEVTGVDYFSLAFDVDSVFDYNDVSKSFTAVDGVVQGVVYGDKLKLKLELIENLESGISSYDYRVVYYLSYYRWNNGQEENPKFENGIMLGNNHTFEIGYPNLVSGEIVFTVNVVVSIGNYEIEKQISQTVNVAKKEVEFTFSDLTKGYNGSSQKPTVTANGFYETDYSNLYVLKCDNKENLAKNAQSYIFYIDSLKNSNYYFISDTSRCVFTISQKPVSVTWSGGENSKTLTYDGKNHFPSYSFDSGAICSGDVVKAVFNYSECKNAGTYKIKIVSVDNQNYRAVTTDEVEYTLVINPASITITFYNTTDRLQTKAGLRKTPRYTIEGNYILSDDLQIQIISKALSATKSGTYKISCELGNDNYDYSIKSATYTLTGYYYIYYQLSNGTTITERVEEGQQPKGVTKDDFNAPRFSSISYSDDFSETGKDLYVTVSLKDYSGLVYTAIFIGVFLLVCLIYYLKRRESKVR